MDWYEISGLGDFYGFPIIYQSQSLSWENVQHRNIEIEILIEKMKYWIFSVIGFTERTNAEIKIEYYYS